jgi:hypothetical protein
LSRGTPRRTLLPTSAMLSRGSTKNRTLRPFKDLIGILTKSDNFFPIEGKPEDFHEWVRMFKELYIDVPAVLKYHLFEFKDVEDVSMQVGRD